MIFLDNCSYKNRNKPKEADSEALVKWKEVKRKLDKINKSILKTKTDLKEVPDNI